MIEAIGWLAVFLVGGFAFSGIIALVTLWWFDGDGLAALACADLAFKAAAVVWIVGFLWLSPITISFGATQ